MTSLPSDAEVERQLSRVRADVIDATHHVRSPKRSRRFRVTRNLVIGGVAIAALTGGTIVVTSESAQVIDTYAYCYAAADLSSDRADITAQTADQLSDNPVAACGELWRVGRLGQQGHIDPNDPNNNFPIPALVACVSGDGVAAVFPREDAETSDQGLCEALGLAAWDSD